MGQKVIHRTQREVFKLWVKALRSGKYKQGEHRLHTAKQGEHEFCCLGVLCDLAVKDGGPAWTRVGGSSPVKMFMHNASQLPDEVMDWLGMSDEHVGLLIDLNDSESWSFKKIAAYIEKHIEPEALHRLEKAQQP